MKKNVTIYRATLFKPSETFVTAQMAYLKKYAATLLGCKKGGGITSKPHDIAQLRTSDYLQMAGNQPVAPLQKALRERKADLVHAHFGPDATQIASTCAKSDIPMLATLHGFDVFTKPLQNRSPQWFSYLLNRRKMASSATTIICVSDFIYAAAKQLPAFRNANLQRHYIGIDYDFLDALAMHEKTSQIAFVGRLVEKKGIKDFVQIVKNLRAEGYKNPVVIVGDGPESSLITELVTKESDITWLGSQPQEKALDVFNNSTIAILPSQTAKNGDAESLGLVFAEALAVGCAPVGYMHGGVTEVVPEELLVTEGDQAALFRKVKEILTEEDKRKNVVAQGKKYLERNFNIRTQTTLLEEIYDHALH